MILQTGGLASGATSTRSRSASAATRRASSIRTMPTCSPPGPIKRTSGTRMRSLTRVSVLMGPPSLIFRQLPPPPAPLGVSGLGYHAFSKKALPKQGPVPTDHGKSRLPNAGTGTTGVPVTGPLSLIGQRWERDSTCCLWHCRRRSRRRVYQSRRPTPSPRRPIGRTTRHPIELEAETSNVVPSGT
jgi:hypothetical protein